MDSKILSNIMQYIKDDDLKKKILSLSVEEIKVLEYFIQNISVGTLVAIRELKFLYRINDPKAVIRKLIEKGLIEQGYGCYSLSKTLREVLYSIIVSGRG
ncbi:MAG: hypothetical protein QXT53_03815 [Ignisphaera sp.]